MVLNGILPVPQMIPLASGDAERKEKIYTSAVFADVLPSDTFVKITEPVTMIMVVGLTDPGTEGVHPEWDIMFEAGSGFVAPNLPVTVTYVGGAPTYTVGSVYHLKFMKNLSGSGYYCLPAKLS